MTLSRKPTTICYPLGNVFFTGNGAGTSIKGPRGKKGVLIDVAVRVTETFACDTTTAKVRVGSSSDADHYAELIITDGTAVTNFFNTVDDRDAIKAEDIPDDTQIEISFVNSVDTGVAAGAGNVYVIIAWD